MVIETNTRFGNGVLHGATAVSILIERERENKLF